MRDLKQWLSSAGISFEDTAWVTPPAYPYGTYLDAAEFRGADDLICIGEHDVTVEIYTEFIDKTVLEPIEALFQTNAVPYKFLGWNWIESEKHYQAAYEISYTEKLEEDHHGQQ